MLFPWLTHLPGQAPGIDQLQDTLQRDVLTGAVALLTVGVVALFGLYIRAQSACASELARVHRENQAAEQAQRDAVALETAARDERMVALLEKVTAAVVKVDASITRLIDDSRQHRRE